MRVDTKKFLQSLTKGRIVNFITHYMQLVMTHFLNPELFYDNLQMEFDSDFVRGLYDCIHELVGNLEVEQKVMLELHAYKTANGMFGSPIAVSMWKTTPPSKNQAIIGSHSQH